MVVSCVVPPHAAHPCAIWRAAISRWRPLIVGVDIELGMPIDYVSPHDVGADRIVNAVAGYDIYRQALIIVDFGTATTFDYVTREGVYGGGAIAPGVGISAEALFLKASKLPRVDISRPGAGYRQRTPWAAFKSGIFYGYVGLVDGLVRSMQSEIPDPVKVIATGGAGPPLLRKPVRPLRFVRSS